MDLKNAKFQGINIVFLGDFNTKIFQPAWFGAEELIRKQEAEDAEIKIIHPDIVSFSLDWLNFEVKPPKLSMSTTKDPYYEPLKDLAIGTFKLLRHTPIRAMGINRDAHFAAESEEQWNSFGDLLAPKSPWEGILEEPGMQSIFITGKRTDDLKGYVGVRVEPSKKIKQGVYITVNDHFEIEKSDSKLGCEEIIGILENSWIDFIERSSRIISSLWEKR